MKKFLVLSYAIGFIFLISCNNDKKENNSDSKNTEQVPALPENTITNSEPGVANSQPALVEPQINQTPPGPAAVSAPVASGINPPHGQPGHNCDIAVGAPLNSAPVKNAPANSTMIKAQPTLDAPAISMPSGGAPGQVQTIQATPPAGPTPPGMNPPHGEPGHDCGIPVGSPLKK